MRRGWKIAGWCVGGLLALLVLLALVAYALLQSAGGQKLLAAKAMQAVPGLVIDGLSGRPPSDLSVARITLADRQGVWLEIDRAHLAWHPLEAFSGHYHLGELTAERVAVMRLPLADASKDKKSGPPHLPKLPHLRIDRLEVAHLDLSAAVTGGAAEVLAVSSRLADQAEGAQATLTAKTLEGPSTALALEATLAETLSVHLTLDEAPGGVLGHLLHTAASSHLAARIEAQGAPALWKAKAILQEDAAPLLQLEADAAPQESATAYRLHWQGRFPSRLAEAYPSLVPLGSIHRGDLAAAITPQGAVDLSKLEILLDGLKITGHGRYEDADGPVALGLAAEAASLAPFAPLTGVAIEGPLSLTLEVKGRMDALGANVTLGSPSLAFAGHRAENLSGQLHAIVDAQQWQIAGRGPLSSDGTVTATFDGEPLSLRYGGTLEQDDTLALKRFELRAKEGAITGEGRFALSGGAVRGTLSAERIDLASLLPASGYRGQVDAKAVVDGTMADMKVTLDGAATRLSGLPGGLDGLSGGRIGFAAQAQVKLASEAVIEKASLDAGALTLSAKGRYGIPDATFDLTLAGAARPKGSPPLDLAATLTGTRKMLTIKQAALNAPGIALAAQGTIDLATRLADLTAGLKAGDLSALSVLAGQKVAGRANVDLTLSAVAGRQQAHATGTLDGIAFGATSLAHADLVAKADDALALRGIDADVKAQGLRSGTTQFTRLHATARSVTAKGNRPALTFRVDAAGQTQAGDNPDPLAVALAGEWQRQGESSLIHLASLAGRYSDQPFALRSPADIQLADGSFHTSPVVIGFGGGRIALEGGVKAGQAKLTGEVDALPLAALLPAYALPPATLSAKLDVTGPATAPTARLSADVGIEAGREGFPPAKLHAAATLAHSRLDAAADLGVAAGSAKAQASLPLRFALQPFALDLAPGAPLKGGATLALPLDSLNGWLRPYGHQLAGRLDGQIALAGTPARPQAQGAIRLTGGDYQGLDSGVCLRHLEARLDGSADRLHLASLTADDGKGGSLAASGDVALAGQQAVGFNATLKRLELLCRSPAVGQVAGTIDAAGTLADLRVGGNVTLGPMAITLPGGPDAKIEEVKIVRSDRKAKPEGSDGPGRTIHLAIAIDAPERIFVRGRGLDAEFQGKLAIHGTAAKPDIAGTLSTKRGRFDLLDRPLSLTRANLTFEGTIPPSPFLDIVAETKVQDTTIDVTLTGAALKPTIGLTSTPALPQDELLARLLFGRDLKSISAFQAIQLAQAAATLAGKGGGPGLLDKARNALGVDTLTVDQGADNSTTVGAGKYISDKVYVGVQQGATPESREVKTEVEVAPSVSATTTTDAQGHTGAGVTWKWDY